MKQVQKVQLNQIVGRSKVKMIKLKFILIAFLSYLYALPALSQDNSRNGFTREEPTSYKCYVEYSGGNGYDVLFIIGYFKNANQAGKTFNRNVVEKGQNKDIRVVHKVHECAVEGDQFKSSQAKRIDNITPR